MSEHRVPAIQVSRTGGPDVLEVTEITVGTPGLGEVKVAVTAVGVNFIDIYHRQGVYPRPLPFIPGSEGAGTVLEVGDGVTDVAPGDRVGWMSISGSYAGAVIGRADQLVPIPDDLSDDQAAALPLQGLTAHALATSSYPIRPGDTVLIHAGAGGVGLLLTQIAKLRGATVFTTASSDEKKSLSSMAGADHVLDYEGFAARARELTDGAGVAAVYDGVGKSTFDESLASLKRRGTMVLFGGASGQVPPFNPQRLSAGGSLTLIRPTVFDYVADRAELLSRAAELSTWVAEGRLTLRIGATYPLVEAAAAHADLAGRKTTGKILLLP